MSNPVALPDVASKPELLSNRIQESEYKKGILNEKADFGVSAQSNAE
ncbi:hypothetical protein [Nostoc sp.]